MEGRLCFKWNKIGKNYTVYVIVVSILRVIMVGVRDNRELVAKFSNWTSRDKEIDEFIQDAQRNTKSYSMYLEWIPW